MEGLCRSVSYPGDPPQVCKKTVASAKAQLPEKLVAGQGCGVYFAQRHLRRFHISYLLHCLAHATSLLTPSITRPALYSYGFGGDLVTHNFSHLLEIVRRPLSAPIGDVGTAAIFQAATSALAVLSASLPLAARPNETQPRHALHWVNMQGLPQVMRSLVASVMPQLTHAVDQTLADRVLHADLAAYAPYTAGALHVIRLYYQHCSLPGAGDTCTQDAAALFRLQDEIQRDAYELAAPVLEGQLPGLLFSAHATGAALAGLTTGAYPATVYVAENSPSSCVSAEAAEQHVARGHLTSLLLEAVSIFETAVQQSRCVSR
jgi:hypothetical protein